MKYKILISCAALFCTVSCSEFLNEMPTGTMTADSELKSNESALALTNNVYRNARVTNRATEGWGSGSMLLLEYMTGKCSSENAQSDFKDFQDLTVSSRTAYLQPWWRFCYEGIADCNLALKMLPTFPALSEDALSRYMGEARFMRALYYFHMVRIFGDVPKIMDIEANLGNLMVSRAPVREIYDEIIIPDLLEAEKSKLPAVERTGRASMWAVKSLLADVYLTYAGYPVQGGSQYYAESAKRSLEVINSNAYSLFPQYESLWDPTKNNTGEFIFQVQYTVNKGSGFNNTVPCIVLPTRSGMSAFQLEFGSLLPTEEFVNSYAQGDKRAEEKQFFFRTYKGHPSKFSAGAPELEFIDFKGYYIHKFFDKNAVDVTGQSGLNWTLYRYADVLLMYAEAQANADGSANQTSLDAVNKIRQRAGLEPFTATGKDAFIKEVWDQRYFELCYENKMWYDMLRTRLIRDDATGDYKPFVGYTTKWNKTYTATQLLFPLPLSEMQANPNLEPNPGY